MGFRLVDMPIDAEMVWGMALIVAGIAAAGYGLLPKKALGDAADEPTVTVSAPEDAPLGPAHWRLMIVLTVALVIDVMKPASLGFVLPGMRDEYEVSRRDRRLASVRRALRHGRRLGALGLARRPVRPARLDPAVGGDLRRHLDLRLDAVAVRGTSSCASSWARRPAACCR